VRKGLIFILAVLLLSGCASLTGNGNDYAKGIEEGKREMRVLAESTKGASPYSEPYKYVWDKAITQKIVVPGAIRGGIFYPAHEETVIIVPPQSRLVPTGGEWETK
jgi:hypothetical protein